MFNPFPIDAPDVAFGGAGAGHEGEAFGVQIVYFEGLVGHGAASAPELAADGGDFYEFAVVDAVALGVAEFLDYKCVEDVIADHGSGCFYVPFYFVESCIEGPDLGQQKALGLLHGCGVGFVGQEGALGCFECEVHEDEVLFGYFGVEVAGGMECAVVAVFVAEFDGPGLSVGECCGEGVALFFHVSAAIVVMIFPVRSPMAVGVALAVRLYPLGGGSHLGLSGTFLGRLNWVALASHPGNCSVKWVTGLSNDGNTIGKVESKRTICIDDRNQLIKEASELAKGNKK